MRSDGGIIGRTIALTAQKTPVISVGPRLAQSRHRVILVAGIELNRLVPPILSNPSVVLWRFWGLEIKAARSSINLLC